MARYLDPKNDVVFKRIFGENKHLLKSFLNALMPFEEGQWIESLHYLSPENVPDNPLKKRSIVDVKCEDNCGRKFIVEMQMEWVNVFPDRMLLSTTRTYSRQINRGESYIVPPVYGLGILNDIYDSTTPECYHRYQMANCKNVSEIIRGLEIIMVELPKFRPETMTEKRMAVLWLKFLKEMKEDVEEVSEDLLANKEISEALELCEAGKYTPAQLEEYERYWMEISNDKAQRESSFAEGLAEGKAEGLIEGKAEGLAEGKAEGLTEATRKIALNLLKKGLSIEDIIETTGLTTGEIQKLKE